MPTFQIDANVATFRRDLAAAKKRHPTVTDDLALLLESLEKNPELGDWIPGLGKEIRKIRVGIKKQNIGKRSGYRLIYFVDRDASLIRLLLFHHKPDIELASTATILKALVTALTEGQPPETKSQGRDA